MFFYLKTSCKDVRILKKFLRFFVKIMFLPISLKFFPRHNKRKFVTVLKSPHVNKTAQEQFEYRFYSKHFLIHSFKPFTFFLLLKKLNNLSFPGLKLEVKGFLGKNKTHKHVLKILNPDNLMLKSISFSDSSKKKLKNTRYKKNRRFEFIFYKQYLQLFDLYGEICLKKNFYL